MFSFVTLGTNNLKKSKQFYDDLLSLIDIVKAEEDDGYIGYAKKDNMTFTQHDKCFPPRKRERLLDCTVCISDDYD